MTWLENIGNVLTTGVICTYAAYDLYRRWQNSAEQESTQVEAASSSMAASSSGSGGGWRTVQQSGPGWHTTTLTFGDSTHPGVLTLHNLLGPESTSLEGPSDLLQLFQDLHFSLQSPMTLGDRDFTEDDYELLSALDDGLRRHTPVSEQALAALPTHKFKCSPQKGACAGMDEDEHTCSICLDDFVAEQEVKTLPCLHHFHTGCIEEWLRQQGRAVSCPVCKTPVFEGQHI